MSNKIKRFCKCGCGGITKPGRKWIKGHTWKGRSLTKKTKRKLSLARKKQRPPMLGHKHSEEAKRKISLASQNMSKETKLKMALAHFKCNPNREYCDAWYDRQYKKDCKKDYCENGDCKRKSKNLIPHHINLNKEDCRPCNVMTLCNSCHTTLHRKLQLGKRKAINPKDYLTIIRPDRITYIHKDTRNKITIRRI